MVSSLVIRGYESYILASGEGLVIRIKALRFLITRIATYKADRVVREGFGRVKSSFY